ncbi:MAG TPA: Crp/Fnr family transcriptional regulator [Candidatus Dormibacteraeota bacterium]|nr:Crp/Fnr family transcriptional regulator [Candidatus Dormibacteraeota bacterium]
MTDAVAMDFATDALRRCRLFARVDDESLALCAAGLRVRRYRKNETIFHEGDPGDSLYIVESGSVKIVLSPPEGEDVAIIATLGRAEFFGELALLDGAPHSATAIAIEPTQTLVLRRETFDELIETQPALRRALFAALAAELRRLTDHVEDLYFLDLPGRLASSLVRRARQEHPDRSTDIRLDWPFTQSELAAMVGGARQSVNRLLVDMSSRGLIRIEGEVLVIPDVERLARTFEW